MKRRGRPPKKIEIGYQKRRSAFDPSSFGVKENPIKDRRWSAPDRVDEHKWNDGYEVYQAKGGETKDASGHVVTKGRMVLMERSKDKARESRAEKVIRTEQKTRQVKELRREDIEKLSRKHGIDLHRHFLDKLEKREDEHGG